MNKRRFVIGLCMGILLCLMACGNSTDNIESDVSSGLEDNYATEKESEAVETITENSTSKIESDVVNIQNESSEEGEPNKRERIKRPYRRTREVKFDISTGERMSETETRYDEKGRKIYIKYITYNAGTDRNETITNEINYNWIDNGNSSTAYLETGTVEGVTFDETGKIIEEIIATQVSCGVTTCTYNGDVPVSRKSKLYIGNQEDGIIEVEFSEYGDVVRSFVEHKSQNILHTMEYSYEYDNYGNILSVVEVTNGDDTQSICKDYVYDTNGFLDKIVVDGMIHTDIVCDQEGNIVEEIIYNGKNIETHWFKEYFVE